MDKSSVLAHEPLLSALEEVLFAGMFGSQMTREYACVVTGLDISGTVSVTEEEVIAISLSVTGLEDAPYQLARTSDRGGQELVSCIQEFVCGVIFAETERSLPFVRSDSRGAMSTYKATVSLRTCAPVAGAECA